MFPGLVQAGHKTLVTEHSPEYLGHIVGNISVIFLEHWCAVRVAPAKRILCFILCMKPLDAKYEIKSERFFLSVLPQWRGRLTRKLPHSRCRYLKMCKPSEQHIDFSHKY